MNKTDTAREAFRNAPDPDAYLRANSGLPGPRANLELLAAAAAEVDGDWSRKWASAVPGPDPTDVFLIMVGIAATDDLTLLHRRASDGEWRIREAVAIALQRLGDDRPGEVGRVALDWSADEDPLVVRAAVAAVAEPRLLTTAAAVVAALEVVDRATGRVLAAPARNANPVRVLRQALGYAWSVVIAADPGRAWPHFVEWQTGHPDDPDIDWIVRENLKKNRLVRLKLSLPPG
jgi:hypothetical protein